jgi:hypothetical protein
MAYNCEVELLFASAAPFGPDFSPEDPMMLRVGIDDRQVYYDVPNIYAIETWERLPDPADTGGEDLQWRLAHTISKGVYRNITQIRTAYEQIDKEQGYVPPTIEEELEKGLNIIDATSATMIKMTQVALTNAGVPKKKQQEVIAELTEVTQDVEEFSGAVGVTYEEQIDDAVWKLFYEGDLSEMIGDIAETYEDLLNAPFTDYETPEGHFPPEKESVQTCIDNVVLILKLAAERGEEIDVEAKALALRMINGPHDFRPHWIDQAHARGQSLDWSSQIKRR